MLYFHKLGISLVAWSGNCSRSSSLMNESITYPTAPRRVVYLCSSRGEAAATAEPGQHSSCWALGKAAAPAGSINKHDKNQYSYSQALITFFGHLHFLFFLFLSLSPLKSRFGFLFVFLMNSNPWGTMKYRLTPGEHLVLLPHITLLALMWTLLGQVQ